MIKAGYLHNWLLTRTNNLRMAMALGWSYRLESVWQPSK